MAKDFSGIGDNNTNIKKGKDLLFTSNEKKNENTLSTNEEVKEKTKIYPVELPASWHTKLKYEISKDTGKSLKELILDALQKTYDLK